MPHRVDRLTEIHKDITKLKKGLAATKEFIPDRLRYTPALREVTALMVRINEDMLAIIQKIADELGEEDE